MASQAQIIKEKFEKYLQADESESVFNQLALYIYATESNESDLHILAKILPPYYLAKLINYYFGDPIRPPKKDKFQDCMLLAITYFLKHEKGLSWTEIKEFLDLPEFDKDMISSISLGSRINRIRDNLNKEMIDLLNQMNLENLEKFIESKTGKNNE